MVAVSSTIADMSKKQSKRGRPPKDGEVFVGISGRVPSVVKKAIEAVAKEEDRSASQQVARILAEWLRERGRLK